MRTPLLSPETTQAARFVLSGRVQGLGVRPAIARLATQLGLSGHVSNQSDGVLVHVEGDGTALHAFEEQLPAALPCAAQLRQFTREDVEPADCRSFEISTGAPSGALATEVPRDLPVCDDCLREIATSADRRHGYAFTSCTNCGPRYSIIDRMPYERADTSMSDFTLCPQCAAEFTSPDDRRFHAQTNACPECGPELTVTPLNHTCQAMAPQLTARPVVAQSESGRAASSESRSDGMDQPGVPTPGHQTMSETEPRSGGMRDGTSDSCRSFAAPGTQTPADLGLAPQAVTCHRSAVQGTTAAGRHSERPRAPQNADSSSLAGSVDVRATCDVPLRSRSEQRLSAITLAAGVLREGGLVALKGLGGYQLVCDATNAAAIERLRERKRRPAKPLAVMVDRRTAEVLTDDDRAAFLDASNAIVVLSPENTRRILPVLGGEQAAEPLAPGMHTLGVFRPTTPLHALLLEAVGRPLVVTSGNVDGEPLAYDDAAADRDLAPLADLVVQHNRRILRPIDDSVVRVIAGRPVTIRTARGIAPLPLGRELSAPPWRKLPACDSSDYTPVDAVSGSCVQQVFPDSHGTDGKLEAYPTLLAVGGQQKAAIALCNGRQSVLGPHIGDLDSLATRERFVEQTGALLTLYDAQPEAVVCDLHPDYFSTQWAERQADERGVPLIRVQHHHAHIAAGMLEHGWLDRTVLGVAFDGTGYGTDGTIWGGEFLHATASDFQRVASLRPFVLPGGEQAIREPWRIAVALLSQAFDDDAPRELLSRRVPVSQIDATWQLAQKQIGPVCSSIGRLFDAVAVLILNLSAARFEGELAMRLEATCVPSLTDASRTNRGSGTAQAVRSPSVIAPGVRWASQPVDCRFPTALEGHHTEEPGGHSEQGIQPRRETARDTGRLAPFRYLGSPGSTDCYDLPLDDSADLLQLDWRPLVRAIVDDVRSGTAAAVMATKFHRALAGATAEVCRRFQLPVVLGGGVFQNRLLTELLLSELEDSGLAVACPGRIPPNDGGLAAGQLAVAAARLHSTRQES